MKRPNVGEVEQRAAPESAALTVEGNRLCGLIPYGVESRDLGGWSEVMESGSLSEAARDDLVATLNHDVSRLLGRYPTTLTVEDRDDGLAWSCELPNGPTGQDVREAVSRGDLRSTSWRMVVGRDRWDGTRRHVEEVRELRDVAVVTTPAYPTDATRAELREKPETTTEPPEERAKEETMENEDRESGTLAVEDRAATAEENEPSVEERVLDALRSVKKGESRSLSTSTASEVAPPELSAFLWQKLRPMSVALASGLRVVPTDRHEITWPKLVTDVDPGWFAEEETITAGDPGFDSLTATPKKLAHRVEYSNEVAADSDPPIEQVLNDHLLLMLGLKLDLAIFEGNQAANPDSIKGLKFVTGIQEVSMGTNGATLTNLDPFADAVSALEQANVPGPYVIALHPRTFASLRKLKEEATSIRPVLADPPSLDAPLQVYGVQVRATSQLSITETQGTSSDASSAYVFAPSEVVLVRRQDAEIEIDRSRLFDQDMSEMRGKLRCDLIVPNPAAVVRVKGIRP